MKSKDITLAAILAALYFLIGTHPLIAMFGFGGVQCRISDALYPLIAILGTPALIGLTVGHFLYNFYGGIINVALGPLDVFGSPLLFLIPKILIWKFGYKAVPLHVVFVALWVPYLICLWVPVVPWAAYWSLVISVGIGEAVAELGLGMLLAKAVEKRL